MIKVSIQPTIYSSIIESMQTGNYPWVVPEGLFYELTNVIVPFTPQPTIIRIETDRIGEPITIEIDTIYDVGSGVDIRDNKKKYTVVAASSVVTTGIQLGRGRNSVTVSVQDRPDEKSFLIIKATTIVALFEAFARVLYSVSKKIIEEQQLAVSSELATRLIEPFVSFQDLLPDIQSLKILATRLMTKGLIHSVGTNLGVTELIKALGITTPIYKSMDKDTFDISPSFDPWTNNGSQFGGLEAHMWLPNLGITSWLAFLAFISNQPDTYDILSIDENEVIIRYQGELQRHHFDFDAFSTKFLSTQATTECFNSIVVTISMTSLLEIHMCAAAYTFDLFVDENNLLGNCRVSLDDNIPFDSNCPFDTDPIDPFTDGWIYLSLSGRFEQDLPHSHVLDTFVVPSALYTGDLCGYEGFYTQLVKNHKYEIDVPINIEITGHIQKALVFILQSPNSTLWSIEVNANTQTLISEIVPTGDVSLYKVTKPDTSEVSFEITDEGVIQVVSPADPSTSLMDTMYILANDSTTWDLNVGDDNIILVTKIFPL